MDNLNTFQVNNTMLIVSDMKHTWFKVILRRHYLESNLNRLDYGHWALKYVWLWAFNGYLYLSNICVYRFALMVHGNHAGHADHVLSIYMIASKDLLKAMTLWQRNMNSYFFILLVKYWSFWYSK